ncbi:MAG: hypothetical protein MI919_28005, partial [Holophagales bacterium]|nr:hypothetical protein [Holophagales bacterium]
MSEPRSATLVPARIAAAAAACLVAAAAVHWPTTLSALLSGLVLLLLSVPWWRGAPRRDRGGRAGRILLPVAAVGLLWSAAGSGGGAVSSSELRRSAEAGYVQAWTELDTAAETLAADIDVATLEESADPLGSDALAGRRRIFEGLGDRLRALPPELDGVPPGSPATAPGQEADAGSGSLTVILLDSDGEAVAWHGPGLLHEPAGYELGARGRYHRRSHTAVTLMSVHPLEDARRPWRVLVGRSYTYEPFPFLTAPFPIGAERPVLRWSVADGEGGTTPEATSVSPESSAPEAGIWRLGPSPHLYLEPPTASGAGAAPSGPAGAGEGRALDHLRALLHDPRQQGSLLVALLGIFEGLRWLFAARAGRPSPAAERELDPATLASGWLGRLAPAGAAIGAGSCMVSGLALLAFGTGAGPRATAFSAAAALVLSVAFRTSDPDPEAAAAEGRGRDRRGAWRAWLPAVIGAAALLAALWFFHSPSENAPPSEQGHSLVRVDPQAEEGGPAAAEWSKLAAALWVLGLLLALPARPAGGRPGLGAYLAVVVGLGASAAHDYPWIAVPLLLLGGVGAARWWRE